MRKLNFTVCHEDNDQFDSYPIPVYPATLVIAESFNYVEPEFIVDVLIKGVPTQFGN